MKRLIVVFVLVIAVTGLTAAPAQAHNCGTHGNPGVIPPQAHPFGHTYGEWGARYEQWVAAIPSDVNPTNDLTGVNAGVGQRGKVWFLTMNNFDYWTDTTDGAIAVTIERTVTIPAGRGVFFPLWETRGSIPYDGADEAEIKAGGAWHVQHVTSLAATVDGRMLRGLFAYRGTSPLFELWWPPDNAIGFDPTDIPPADSIADGYWIMLAPLNVGHHDVHWTSVLTYTAAEGLFDLTVTRDITYHITVRPACRY